MTERAVLRCSTHVRVYSERYEAWRLAESNESGQHVRDVQVSLEIQSDGTAGVVLVQTPDGCFTADSWFATLDEALDAAAEMFGVGRDQWAGDIQAAPLG